jgi:hypothetical protein
MAGRDAITSTLRHLLLLGVPALVLGAAVVGCVSSVRHAPGDECPALATAHAKALLERAAEQKRLRVLVGLGVPIRPEGELTAEAVAAQRAAIRDAQDRLLAELRGTVQLQRRLETAPFLTLETDAEGLRRLLCSGHVASVEEERRVRPRSSEF